MVDSIRLIINDFKIDTDRCEKLSWDQNTYNYNKCNGDGCICNKTYGKEILHTDGTVLIVNDKYIRESLIDPLRYIVEGYTPIMPSYAPILNGNDIENIIAYIKTLK